MINGFDIYVSHYATALDEAEYVFKSYSKKVRKAFANFIDQESDKIDELKGKVDVVRKLF